MPVLWVVVGFRAALDGSRVRWGIQVIVAILLSTYRLILESIV